MTNCPWPLTYPHLPETFTGNRVTGEFAVGVESAGEPVLGEDVICEHPTSVRWRANINNASQRNFMGGIVPLERTDWQELHDRCDC